MNIKSNNTQYISSLHKMELNGTKWDNMDEEEGCLCSAPQKCWLTFGALLNFLLFTYVVMLFFVIFIVECFTDNH